MSKFWWEKPGFDWHNYTKIILDPIVLEIDQNDFKTEELQSAVNDFRKIIIEGLSPEYIVVNKPGPDVLRIRPTITDINTCNPVLNTLMPWLIRSAAHRFNLQVGFVDSDMRKEHLRREQKSFSAKAIFDCGWYVNLVIGPNGPSIQFMQPQKNMPAFGGAGIMLNFKVDDVDAEYHRLSEAGLQPAMPLEDHPWGDRGFSVIDPIGNSVYIYSDREPSDEFKKYYK